MQKKPFASFCFSTYKRPVYLQTTLKSILQQTSTDYEVIVSDNDIEESGRNVVESFNDPRFKYFANQENLGMKKSFNKSLERSSGEFIVMIADDDPVYPEMLETLFNLQSEYPGFGMYLGGCDWFCVSHEVGKLYNFKVGTNSCLSSNHDLDYKQTYSPGEFLNELFSFGIFPHYLWSTCIVRREILIEQGGVPEYGTPFLGDYAYMSTVGSHSGCVIINRSLGCQTLHQENFGRNQNEQIPIAARNFPLYIEKKASHLPEWPQIKTKMLRFTGLWVVSHMAFLNNYYKKKGDQNASLRNAEKEVFKIDYMKKYRFKYFLKKNFPLIHDIAVKLKKVITK
jgi:glycosyltransferase involved in cell wall biosynthesis